MTSNSPRNMADWIRIIERNQVALRGIGGTIRSAVDTVREEQAAKDARTPTAPVELVHQTGFYLDTSSRQRVRLILDFPDVTKATDGTGITIAQYELWGRDVTVSALDLTTSAVPSVAVPGATLPGLASTPENKAMVARDEPPFTLIDTSASSAFRTGRFLPDRIWELKVRAMGATTTIPGRFSETVTVVMEADRTPPPQPTAPRLEIKRGTISAFWDGQSVSGPMPADFKYAVLAHGTGSSPTREIARFGRDGGFKVVADIDYYDPQFFRLQAYDEAGNAGPWSEQGVGYTTPLVDKDIILSTIDAAKTHLKNINAGVSILPNTIITEHLVVTEEMTAAIANFLHVKADQIDVNDLAADTIFTGLLDGVLIRGDMFEGREFYGGTFTGLSWRTHQMEYTGVKVDSAGMRIYDDNGNLTINLSSVASDENLLIGNLATSVVGDPGVKIQNASEWGLPAILYSYDGGIGVQQAASFMRYTITGDPELVHRAPNRAIVGGTGLGFVRIEGDLILSLGKDATQKMRIEQPFHMEAWSPVDGHHAMFIAGKQLQLTATNGNLRLISGGYYVQAPGIYDKTTGVGPNVYIESDGGLFRSVSASKYKILPEAAALDDALLEVEVKDWIDLYSAEEYARLLELEDPSPGDVDRMERISLRRIPGALAEDVEAAGGAQFVTYGADGEIEGLMYDRFVLARTALLKKQLDQALARIAALESATTAP